MLLLMLKLNEVRKENSSLKTDTNLAYISVSIRQIYIRYTSDIIQSFELII